METTFNLKHFVQRIILSPLKDTDKLEMVLQLFADYKMDYRYAVSEILGKHETGVIDDDIMDIIDSGIEIEDEIKWNSPYQFPRQHPEIISDIAYFAGADHIYSGDSRADMVMFVEWSEEFLELHSETDWEKEDYMLLIMDFSERKHKEFKDCNIGGYILNWNEENGLWQATVDPNDTTKTEIYRNLPKDYIAFTHPKRYDAMVWCLDLE